jgi:hypothetical protein
MRPALCYAFARRTEGVEESEMSDNDTSAPPSPPSQGLAKSLGLSDILKRGLADYLATHEIRPATGELNVDLEFMRDHAGPLLAHLMRSATQNLVPKDMRFTVPTPPPADQPGAAPVNVNFDLGDFIAKLFNPPSTNPPR